MARQAPLLPLLLLACGGESVGDHLAQIDTLPGGMTKIVSRAPAEPGRWQLVEEVRILAGDTGRGAIGRVRDVGLAEDGTVLVADVDPVTVHVFDPTGEWLRDIGRAGSGPAEFEDAFLAVHGDTVFVQDRRNSRVNRFLLDGTPLEAIASACCMTEGVSFADDGRLLVPLPSPPDQRRWVVAAAGAAPDTIALRDDRIGPPPVWQVRLPEGGGFGKIVPLVPSVRATTDPLGTLVSGWSGEYLLRRSTTGGDTTLLFGRTLDDVAPFTLAEREAFAREHARRDATTEGVPVELLLGSYDVELLPEQRELFDALWVDGSGRTWVQLVGDSGAVRLDVFDREGRWLDTVTLPRSGWPTAPYHRPVAWSRDGVVVAVDGDEGTAIIRYRIRGPGARPYGDSVTTSTSS